MASLSRNCTECHEWTYPNEQAWVSSGYVVMGQPNQSPLFRPVKGAGAGAIENMPRDRSISGEDVFAIRDWIENMRFDVPLRPPVYSITTPISPSRTEINPRIRGEIYESEITSVQLFSDQSCTVPIGRGTAAEFTSSGIMLTVPDNQVTNIYARGLTDSDRQSACAYMTQYVHDNRAPAEALSIRTNPLSPSSTSTTPNVLGTLASDVVLVELFTTADCSGTPVVTGSRSQFESSGLPIAAVANTTTSIYARYTDAAGNRSDCPARPSITYSHDSLAPSGLALTRTNPVSPSPDNVNPRVIGTVSDDATGPVTISLYHANCAGSPIGFGSRADFIDAGIAISALANNTTRIFAVARDALNNASPCVELGSYVHDGQGPANPIFIAINPVSPSRTNTRPTVQLNVSTRATRVSLYPNSQCTNGTEIGTATSDFSTTGILASVTANNTTRIHAKAFDQFGRESGCAFMTEYVHDSLPPANPTIVRTTPTSPSNSVLTPSVLGTVAADVASVQIHNAAGCASAAIASGSRSAFETTGLPVTVAQNVTTSFYVRVTDAAGNQSACPATPQATYSHDNQAPTGLAFVSTNPVSPSSNNASPRVIGALNEDRSEPSRIYLYNANCTSTPIGAGTAADFVSTGIPISAVVNGTTNIMAIAEDAAGNRSACTTMGQYVHEGDGPSNPVFVSIAPTSPSSSSTTPVVRMTASANTSRIDLYSTDTCNVVSVIGTARSGFSDPGITATVPSNGPSSTRVFAKAFDQFGRESGCVFMAEYRHDSNPPTLPTALRTSPTSPNRSVRNPAILGTADDDTASIQIFTTSSCTGTPVATGTRSALENAGIPVSVAANTTTSFYIRAVDHAGNISPCPTSASLTYTHDDRAPTGLGFVASNPVSPSPDNVNPRIIGTLDNDAAAPVSVALYNGACTGSPIGSGSRSDFIGTGINIAATSNGVTDIHAIATDGLGNSTGCVRLANYEHDGVGPENPVLISITPTSPSNTSTTPVLRLTTSSNTTRVEVFSNDTCNSVSQIGSALSNFATTGVTATVAANTASDVRIHGRSYDRFGRSSACTFLANYRHDSVAPSAPQYARTTPNSPTTDTTPPRVIGTSSADTTTVRLFSDSGCSTQIGSGGKAEFEGSGIEVTQFQSPGTTSIYARALDNAGNQSACTAMVDYVINAGSGAGVASTRAVPRIGDRHYISAVLRQVYGSGADAILFEDIDRRISSFGGPCDPHTELFANATRTYVGDRTFNCHDEDYVQSLASSEPLTTTLREGWRIRACERLTYNTTTVNFALGRIHGGGATVNPTSSTLTNAYQMFYPGRTPSSQELSALTSVSDQGTTVSERWRFVLVTLCMSPGWETP
jgi:hypothetical protein